ncbi:MAG: hypothetical protein OEZ01_03295 [Candidatus Heimdallarchaeota archaeon]|nr:hypothetical protein [Candidatus Heimdallarchaeota archaeon]MDH5645003.1 hypothetical protein [Candidatus Heimdallarchaeota archaeon]
MNIWVTLLGSLIGIWMFIDGTKVIRTGTYFGPENPGPWKAIFVKFGINPLKIGPLFVAYGVFWLLSVGLYLNGVYGFILFMAVVSLWYIPLGTLFSVIILILL